MTYVSSDFTSGTGGTFTLDLYEHWLAHWAMAWRDLGRLITLRANEEHIPKHEVINFLVGDVGHCECFNCRVVTAWQKRHQPIAAAKTRGRKVSR